jgi:hypothetical protein
MPDRPTEDFARRAAAAGDRRYEPYLRPDGWAQATRTHPAHDDVGWLCQACGRPSLAFRGQGPRFDVKRRRYVGPDDLVCVDCWHAG